LAITIRRTFTRYGRAKAIVRIADGEFLSGELPPTAVRLVREWALARRPGHAPEEIAGLMLTKVLELEVVSPYGLRVRFSNGQSGTHDCSSLVREPGPMIEPLRDPTSFARAFLEFGAPT
jgi:Protein of unknown function (DUF2442)